LVECAVLVRPETRALLKAPGGKQQGKANSGRGKSKGKSQLMGEAKNKPELVVVEKVSDLPFHAPDDAKGVLHGGVMYLVSEQIALPEDANEAVFHEFVGHFGLRGFFGDGLNAALDRIHANNPLVRQYTNEWLKNNRDLLY